MSQLPSNFSVSWGDLGRLGTTWDKLGSHKLELVFFGITWDPYTPIIAKSMYI
jgi:hypothetical protein